MSEKAEHLDGQITPHGLISPFPLVRAGAGRWSRRSGSLPLGESGRAGTAPFAFGSPPVPLPSCIPSLFQSRGGAVDSRVGAVLIPLKGAAPLFFPGTSQKFSLHISLFPQRSGPPMTATRPGGRSFCGIFGPSSHPLTARAGGQSAVFGSAGPGRNPPLSLTPHLTAKPPPDRIEGLNKPRRSAGELGTSRRRETQ
jgi:hypothetical protein